MQSLVNTVVTPVLTERALCCPGVTWFITWPDPFGAINGVYAVVDDFGNLVEAGR